MPDCNALLPFVATGNRAHEAMDHAELYICTFHLPVDTNQLSIGIIFQFLSNHQKNVYEKNLFLLYPLFLLLIVSCNKKDEVRYVDYPCSYIEFYVTDQNGNNLIDGDFRLVDKIHDES